MVDKSIGSSFLPGFSLGGFNSLPQDYGSVGSVCNLGLDNKSVSKSRFEGGG